MINRKVQWDKVDLDKISIGPLDFKNPENSCRIFYEYPEGKGMFLLEGPDRCPMEVTYRVDCPTKWGALLRFKKAESELANFKIVIENIFSHFCKIIAENKELYRYMRNNRPGVAYGVITPLMCASDYVGFEDEDGEMFICCEFFHRDPVTIIADTARRPIPWQVLERINFRAKPLIRFSKIKLGVVKIKLVSAFVTELYTHKRSSLFLQAETHRDFFARADPEIAAFMQRKIDSLSQRLQELRNADHADHADHAEHADRAEHADL